MRLYKDIVIDYLSSQVIIQRYKSARNANNHKGIFPGKVNKWFCYSTMVFEVAWGIGAFFLSLFQCKPVQSYWLIQSPVRDCLDPGILYYTTSGLNILTDCTYSDI